MVLILIITLSGSVLSCDGLFSRRSSTLEGIVEKGKIVLITQNSANTYYIYRDEPHGFEYELAKAFADHLGVELEVVTPGWLDMFKMLDRGEGDFIAAGVTILPSRLENVDFSDPYMDVQQEVIVHRINRKIRKKEDLAGRTVHVRTGTSYQKRLEQLLKEGVDLNMVTVPDVPTEELIAEVAEREIEITVADSNIALLNRRYNPDIRIAFPITGKQSLGWAVRKGNTQLLEVINYFLSKIQDDGTFQDIYDHYYSNRVILGPVDINSFKKRIRSRLPRYEKTIRQEAKKYDFDWRLIAAMIYQESHFNPRARSYTGVRGLMQITQATAREMGIKSRMDPQDSIRAGVRYLARLRSRFSDIEDDRERLLFALASYNIGYGHVRDAQGLAKEKGLDPDTWENLKTVLPLLRRSEYYRHLRYGYARGTEPVRYLSHVLTYYDILRYQGISGGEITG
ncbi:MAG: membrane-bound lytic murein transglycosylase MltF [Pseudomonadota bacterium]